MKSTDVVAVIQIALFDLRDKYLHSEKAVCAVLIYGYLDINDIF